LEDKQKLKKHKRVHKNREAINKYTKKWAKTNKDKVKGYQKKYARKNYLQNKDSIRNKQKQYYQENREKIILRTMNYRKKHPEYLIKWRLKNKQNWIDKLKRLSEKKIISFDLSINYQKTEFKKLLKLFHSFDEILWKDKDLITLKITISKTNKVHLYVEGE